MTCSGGGYLSGTSQSAYRTADYATTTYPASFNHARHLRPRPATSARIQYTGEKQRSPFADGKDQPDPGTDHLDKR